MIALLLLALLSSGSARSQDKPERVAKTGAAVTTHTYLKASAGNREALARFVESNWFAMDAIAVEQGLFQSYRLLQNAEPEGDWDWIVEVVYSDECGYACVSHEFERIRSAHDTVLVDGKAMPELGSVTRSVSFRAR
jgi:hypothetical protein